MRDSRESPRGQRLKVHLEATRTKVRVFSQSRDKDIPLEARDRDRVPRMLVWHNQLGVLKARVMEAFMHSMRLVARSV